MKSKIANQFMMNYLIMFLLSIIATAFAFMMLSYASDIISEMLVKNIYTADSVMKDDYSGIDSAPIVQNGGGVQIIDDNLEVVYTAGLNTIKNDKLNKEEFTDFLIKSKSKGVQHSYDIMYNPTGRFWLVVTFPASIRLDVSLVYNTETESKDMKSVSGVFITVILLYLFLLAIIAAVFSRITALRITHPLRALAEGTNRMRNGDYSARVNLNLKNEFGHLRDTFNAMAERIEEETSLRKQSEEERKKMILDVSHDLKNPLASVVGYTELFMKNQESLSDEQLNYLQIINKNGHRANMLLNELFELSRVESPEFILKTSRVDVCEYMRRFCGEIFPYLEQNKFEYEFNIPDTAVYAMLDTEQMNRVFHNLADNAIRYNTEGTLITVNLYETPENVVIEFRDNGIGVPEELKTEIFKPFVRVDNSRNSQTGGTGLGLCIAHKIVTAHGGTLELSTVNKGCTFIITIQKI
ncbi:HAMP domain-containing sensor histidine kinase [Sedimentibacter sp.]|uniref:sensor histidine kinase n=1 Tax=Sedimentibacter sp. TaxID=1960295 RepID=UPI0028968E9B|nr:HAMP domain-containing sensor histidine kinase [Sedimentibacter sp.]